jgi:hypothetical protein
MFSFAPVGLPVTVVGIAFTLRVGWRLLPAGHYGSGPAAERPDVGSPYDLCESLFVLQVPEPRGSGLVFCVPMPEGSHA